MMTVDYERCTGCEACVQKCPKQCISMVPGEFGFLYPKIDEDKCVDCHLCEKTCPIHMEKPVRINQKAYAAVHRDRQTLKHSTSGGAFTALAEETLKAGGVVYGAIMDHFTVRHIRVDSPAFLPKLRGSKYLQSKIGMVFKDAESDLKAGRVVLFSGTPCQVEGLKRYLGKEYERFITVDIVCHGVGSQAYFDKFMTTLIDRWPLIKELRFRSKTFAGWSCSSGGIVLDSKDKNETELPFYCHRSYYYQYFLDGDIYRKSCYICKYASLNRPGDITLGDFWGVEKLRLPMDTHNGCSLVITNTEKGGQFLERITVLSLVEVPLIEATRQNKQLMHPSPLREKRALRLQEYETRSGAEIAKLYMKYEKKSILKGNLKLFVPYHVKTWIRRWI